MTVKMSQLRITRDMLAAWAAECGLDLVPKPPYVLEDPSQGMVDEAMRSAQEDDRMRMVDGIAKVYFLQENGTGAIKIGTSKHLKKRIDELTRELPSESTLLATTDGWRETEWVLQRRFVHARIRGEWFRPVPELLEYIAGLKAAESSSAQPKLAQVSNG
jgi:hypothetical protein